MRYCLKDLLYPVRIGDRAHERLPVVLGVLVGPLTTVCATGEQACLVEEDQTEQFPPVEPVEVHFDHISTKDGPSEGRGWSITQDRWEFLWFTIMDGINHYDG